MACCEIALPAAFNCCDCVCTVCEAPCEPINWKCCPPELAKKCRQACEDVRCGSGANDKEDTHIERYDEDGASYAPTPTPTAPVVLSATSNDFIDPRSLFHSILADPVLVDKLASEGLAYTMSNGVTMLKNSTDPTIAPTIMHAPVTLLPHRLEEGVYKQLQALAMDFNLLYERVSRDVPFLLKTLEPTAELDPFLRKLLDMLRRIENDTTTPKQPLHLAINRSDYLMHYQSSEEVTEHREQEVNSASSPSDQKPLQVEFNTISAGAGSLSNKTCDMHKFLIERYIQKQANQLLAANSSTATSTPSGTPLRLNLPSNPVIKNITAAMAEAHQLFLKQQVIDTNITDTAVLFIVQAVEANMSDQRLLEYGLWNDFSIPVVRMTLAEIYSNSRLDEQGRLWIRPSTSPNQEQLVSLSYFRAGYTPRDYLSADESEWHALERIERSMSIKCPRLAYHLSGTKKIQQVLTDTDVLARFLPDHAQAERVRATFAGMWQPTPESIAHALSNPSEFVLKPQREGGGNNLWGEELIEALKTKSVEELQPYILMSRIRSRPVVPITADSSSSSTPSSYDSDPRLALKFGRFVLVPHALSELGMMGALISEANNKSSTSPSLPSSSSTDFVVHRNAYVGYLLRTKDESLNEGGLMSGAGAIDSLVLVPKVEKN